MLWVSLVSCLPLPHASWWTQQKLWLPEHQEGDDREMEATSGRGKLRRACQTWARKQGQGPAGGSLLRREEKAEGQEDL